MKIHFSIKKKVFTQINGLWGFIYINGFVNGEEQFNINANSVKLHIVEATIGLQSGGLPAQKHHILAFTV